MTTDRLTEIKARVANATNLTYKWGAYEMLADLKFALGEIERLTGERQDTNMAIDIVCAERDRLRAVMDKINMLACYASEENTDAREAALLEIGKVARAALEGSK